MRKKEKHECKTNRKHNKFLCTYSNIGVSSGIAATLATLQGKTKSKTPTQMLKFFNFFLFMFSNSIVPHPVLAQIAMLSAGGGAIGLYIARKVAITGLFFLKHSEQNMTRKQRQKENKHKHINKNKHRSSTIGCRLSLSRRTCRSYNFNFFLFA